MAVIYCRSTDGNDSDSGATWALAKATLAAAITAAGNGGTVYVSKNHAESAGSSKTFTGPANPTDIVMIYCVDDAGSPEPPTTLATTATVTTTGSTNMTFNGHAYCYGITFNSGTTGGAAVAYFVFTSTSPWYWRFENCNLKLVQSAGAQYFQFGAQSTSSDHCAVDLINCGITFGNTSQYILTAAPVRMIGGSIAVTGSIPTNVFKVLSAGNSGYATLNGVDLSAASGNLVENTANNVGTFYFSNCKIHSSATLVTGETGSVAGQGGVVVRAVNCDSGDTNYKYTKVVYQGYVKFEGTIVKSGGASDGATSISRRMTTGAGASFVSPLESDPMIFWNEVTGSSITVTVNVITDNVTLTDREAWVEVEYLGTSGYPVSSFANDRATGYLTTASNQTTDSVSSWTTTGLTTPVKQNLAVSFTPQEKGPVRVSVFLAKASATMYFDPKPLVS